MMVVALHIMGTRDLGQILDHSLRAAHLTQGFGIGQDHTLLNQNPGMTTLLHREGNQLIQGPQGDTRRDAVRSKVEDHTLQNTLMAIESRLIMATSLNHREESRDGNQDLLQTIKRDMVRIRDSDHTR